MSTPVALPDPTVGPPDQVPPGHAEEAVVTITGAPGRALCLYGIGLACCAVETRTAELRSYGLEPLGATLVPAAAQADVLVVAGTVTSAMAPVVRRLYESMPQPRYVIAFGACATSGGPYWDSYSVVTGADQVVPVDVYVPGCPPRPEALPEALRELHRVIEDRAARSATPRLEPPSASDEIPEAAASPEETST